MQKFSAAALFLMCQSLILNGVQNTGRVIEFQINRNSSSAVDAFKQRINEGYVIVDFYAHWCGPCKNIAPTFSSLSSQYPQVLFMKVDIDNYKEIATAYNIRSIPQLLLFKNGSLVETCAGQKSKTEITRSLNKHFK